MKTERRHELQTNELADWLGTHIQSVRPYTKVLVAPVVIIAAGTIAFAYLTSQGSGRVAQGWQDFYAAAIERDAAKLDTLADEYPDTTLTAWARQMAADAYLTRGAGLLHIDRDDAAAQLENARKAYTAVLNQTNSELVEPRALLGLAQVYEARGEVDEALKRYGQVIEKWPQSALAEVATQRRDFLTTPATRQFVAWFDDQQPQLPPVGQLPASGLLPGQSGAVPPIGGDAAMPGVVLPFDTLEPPDAKQTPDTNADGQPDAESRTGTDGQSGTGGQTGVGDGPPIVQPAAPSPAGAGQPAAGGADEDPVPTSESDLEGDAAADDAGQSSDSAQTPDPASGTPEGGGTP